MKMNMKMYKDLWEKKGLRFQSFVGTLFCCLLTYSHWAPVEGAIINSCFVALFSITPYLGDWSLARTSNQLIWVWTHLLDNQPTKNFKINYRLTFYIKTWVNVSKITWGSFIIKWLFTFWLGSTKDVIPLPWLKPR